MGRVVVDGAGTVGARVCRQLVAAGLDEVVVLTDRMPRLRALQDAFADEVDVQRRSIDWATSPQRPDVLVCARAASDQLVAVDLAIEAGVHVVATSDDPVVVRELLERDDRARAAGVSVAIGVTFSPGLSCLLASYGARSFDIVDEVRVASIGTGGPSCARRRLGAVVREAPTWKNGWTMQSGGSGRELAFFPDPIGSHDCYRGALAEPYLLARIFPDAERLSARLAVPRVRHAFRWLPSLRAPKDDDGPGAIRVELRGRRDGVSDTVVLGAIDRASVASAAAVAVVAAGIVDGSISRRGVFGLAELDDTTALLKSLARLGVTAAVFDPTGESPDATS